MVELLVIVGLAAGAAYWYAKSKTSPSASVPSVAQANNSAALAAQDSAALKNLQSSLTAQSQPDASAASLGSAATGSAASIAAGASVFAIVGGAITGLLGAIRQHHQFAVQREAALLNNAVPRTINLYLQIFAAVQAKQLSPDQAKQLLLQLQGDYYILVSPPPITAQNILLRAYTSQLTAGTIQGKWPFPEVNTIADYLKANNVGRPGTCNGPCVVGHFWIEGYRQLVKIAINDVAAGRHGTLSLAAIPAHAGFAGFSAVTVNY